MSWNANRILRFLRHTWELMRRGDVLPVAEKILRREDGSYSPYAFVDLPLGLTRIEPFLFVACPHITRKVLHHHASFGCPTSPFNRGWIADIFLNELGDTLFTAHFSKHTKLRQFISHYFRQSLDKRFGDNLYLNSMELIEAWVKKGQINATRELPSFTAKAIIDNFIGEVDEPERLHEAMDLILRNMERQFQLKRPHSSLKMKEARQCVKEVAAQARKAKVQNESLLQAMAQAVDEKECPLFSLEDIEAMACFLFLAGQETVASVLPALLYHCTPEFQAMVREEWEQETDQTQDAIVRFSKKSKWVQALVNESLRLFPPAYTLTRFSREAMQLEGITLPKEMAIVTYPIFFQRDPSYWGSDAELFNPSRWFTSTQEGSPAFMPFGIGPNHCLGQPFARLEMGLLLTLLCLNTKWKALNKRYELCSKFSLASKQDVLLSLESRN